MSDSREMFEKAVLIVLGHEGGHVNHPADHGGETNFGISSHHHPEVDVANLTREQAIEIYWTKYWEGRGYDLLPEIVGMKVFDLAVNMGARQAVICLQRALLACERGVEIDGLLGPITTAACWQHRIPAITLLVGLRSEAAGEYRLRLSRDPSQAVFADGWMRRAYA